MAHAQPQVASDERDPREASRDLPTLREASSRGRRVTTAELREIESLRAVNAHLLRELAAELVGRGLRQLQILWPEAAVGQSFP